VSIALGTGAPTAIFQLLDAISLRSLPVKAPQELVELRPGDMTHARGSSLRDNALSNPLWEQTRAAPASVVWNLRLVRSVLEYFHNRRISPRGRAVGQAPALL
jgi:hypothetical protein